MSDTTKLDERRRGVFPLPFRPGDNFTVKVSGNSVTFNLVKPAEVPVLKARRVGGKLYLPKKVNRETIAAAIRADRDER